MAEYLARKDLRKLGFTEDLKSLPAYKAECFATISKKIEEIRAKKEKEAQAKSKAKRGRRR